MSLVYTYIARKKKSKKSFFKKKTFLKFCTKNQTISKLLVNSHILIHQGKQYTKRQVYPFMVGHKIGEFILTRKPFFYPPKKKKKR